MRLIFASRSGLESSADALEAWGRAEWRAAKREQERRRAEATESQKTDHFARCFLLALLATALLFLGQWLWANSAA